MGSPKTKVQRIPWSGWPSTGALQEGMGGGVSPGLQLWDKHGLLRRAQSPFPRHLLTLLAGTAHCQQLLRVSPSFKDMAHEGRKVV